jgi:hypothetical protein
MELTVDGKAQQRWYTLGVVLNDIDFFSQNLALQVVALGPNAAITTIRSAFRASFRALPFRSSNKMSGRCVRPFGYDQVAAPTTESDNGQERQ